MPRFPWQPECSTTRWQASTKNMFHSCSLSEAGSTQFDNLFPIPSSLSPGPCDDVPVVERSDAPHRLCGMGDGLHALPIFPHTYSAILTTCYKVWPIGKERQAIHVVGVPIVNAHTIARRQPAAYRGVVGAWEECTLINNDQASHTVLMTWLQKIKWNRIRIRIFTIPVQVYKEICLTGHSRK